MSLTLQKNDKKARVLIFTFSAIVFVAVTLLQKDGVLYRLLKTKLIKKWRRA